jgi:RecA-family ATPase
MTKMKRCNRSRSWYDTNGSYPCTSNSFQNRIFVIEKTNAIIKEGYQLAALKIQYCNILNNVLYRWINDMPFRRYSNPSHSTFFEVDEEEQEASLVYVPRKNFV